MKNRKIKTQNFIIINLMIIFVLLFTFEAKADLVDELIKKHKLDPKNNPKDQCWLMHQLELETIFKTIKDYKSSFFGKSLGEISKCEASGVCSTSIEVYELDQKKGKWHLSDSYSMIYRDEDGEKIGISITSNEDLENNMDITYDYNKLTKKHKGFPNKIYLFGDLSKHFFFNKIKLQKEEFFVDFDNEKKLRFAVFDKLPKDISYIKTKGCYIKEFKITNSDKKLYQL